MWSRRLGRLVIIGGPVFALLNVAGIFASSQSWFCHSCHSMDTYYDSWEASAHNDVGCTACHIPPGMGNFIHAKMNGMGQLVDTVLSREGSKPSAKVTLFSCSRSGCHDIEEVRETAKTEGTYLFQHDKHLDLTFQGIEVGCATCHSHVRGEEHFSINTNTCIACHLPIGPQVAPVLADLTAADDAAAASPPDATQPATATAEKTATRDCRKCHEPPAEPVQYQGLSIVHADYLEYGAGCESCHHTVTAPAPKVTDTQCYACHDNGLEETVDVVQLHDQHANGSQKVECFSCHGLIAHGKGAQAMRLNQFDCASCHLNQHDIQQSTYKLVRSDSATTTAPHRILQGQATQPAYELAATPMFLAHVDCTGCHTQARPVSTKPQSNALVYVATPEACDRCHKPGFGQQMVPQWQSNTKQLYESVSRSLQVVSDMGFEPANKAVAEATALLEMVRLDGSWGVHNPPYTERLLHLAAAKVAEARALAAGRLADDTGESK